MLKFTKGFCPFLTPVYFLSTGVSTNVCGPPMGSQIDLCLFIFPSENFFGLQYTCGICSFLIPFFFIPRRLDQRMCSPLWGPSLISFFLISSHKKTFWVSLSRRYLLIFEPENFLSPEGRPTYVVPLWVPY